LLSQGDGGAVKTQRWGYNLDAVQALAACADDVGLEVHGVVVTVGMPLLFRKIVAARIHDNGVGLLGRYRFDDIVKRLAPAEDAAAAVPCLDCAALVPASLPVMVAHVVNLDHLARPGDVMAWCGDEAWCGDDDGEGQEECLVWDVAAHDRSR